MALVITLAFCVRATTALVLPLSGDDKICLDTVNGILQGHHYIYMSHLCYLAPLSQYMAACLFHWFGASLLALRFPDVIWGALAAGLWWGILSRLMPSRLYAIVLAFFLAVPSFSNMESDTPVSPYALGRFLIAVLVLLTINFRLQWSYCAVMAFFGGASFYIFPLSKLPFLFCLAWLALRDGELITDCVNGWKKCGVRTRLGFVFCLATSAVLLGLAAYHYLTRPGHYHLPRPVAILWCVGFALAVPAGVIFVQNVSFKLMKLAPFVIMLVVAFFIAWIPDSVFRMEFTKLPPEEQKLYWNANRLVVTQIHDWPARARFTVQHIVPEIYMGQLMADKNHVGGGYVSTVPLVPLRLGLGLAVIVILLTGFYKGLQQAPLRPVLVITVGSTLTVILLMMVSYRSANLYNYRYCGVFSPGLFLATATAFRFSRWGLGFLSLVTILGCIDLVLGLFWWHW